MNTQWLKFGILLLICMLNLILGIFIIKKNKTKQESIKYFLLLCFSAFCWSLNIGLIAIVTQDLSYRIIANFTYFTGNMILISFFMFSKTFPYYIKNRLQQIFNFLLLLLSTLTIYILFSNKMVENIYIKSNQISYSPNQNLHLAYGILYLVILIYSYHNLLKKYISSSGINKERILIVIVGTITSFIFAIYFDWYLIHINQFNFFWIGPIFILIMNFSIAYLLFKKN